MIIQAAGESLELLAQKALFWPKQKILIVADLHLGKAAAFRKAGVPIPEGDMERDLMRLQALILEKKVERCIIVGDLFHHRTGMGEPTLAAVESWMHNLPCALDLVLGNHDVALKSVPHGHWKLCIHPEQLLLSPFVFAHHPSKSTLGYVISGHVHPQASIRTGNKVHRFPCFYFQEECAILPAFSSFAGGCSVDKSAGEAFACLGEKVIRVT